MNNHLNDSSTCRLSELPKGKKAIIVHVSEQYLRSAASLEPGELERRLLEIGFLEGIDILVSHEGLLGKDPIVVLLQSCHFVALRRREAEAVLVQMLPS